MTLDTTASPDDFQRVRPQRIQPLAALRAFRKLIRNKEDTAQVFAIMRALSGRSVSRGYNRLLRTMEGGRQAFLRDEHRNMAIVKNSVEELLTAIQSYEPPKVVKWIKKDEQT